MTAGQTALFKHRKYLGMRQLDLARLAHVSQADIVFFEKGRRLPSIGQAKRIALALGLKVEALFTDGFRKQDNRGRPIKGYMPPEPVMLPNGSRPADSIRIVCPHCGASSYSLSDIPGVSYQCVSCSRPFIVDANGRGHVPEPRPGRGEKRGVMSDEGRERISAGQRRRHARERAEEKRDEDATWK